jgi:hypothetical protein
LKENIEKVGVEEDQVEEDFEDMITVTDDADDYKEEEEQEDEDSEFDDEQNKIELTKLRKKFLLDVDLPGKHRDRADDEYILIKVTTIPLLADLSAGRRMATCRVNLTTDK